MIEPARTGKRWLQRWFQNPRIAPYVFVAPFVLYFLVIYLYPTIATVVMSFQRIDGPTTSVYIGAANYNKLFSKNFIDALRTTARYTVWDIAILVPVPLFVAVLLHSGVTKAPNFFKSVLFIPALTSVIVAGIVFRLAFGSLETSVANRVRGLFGMPPIAWLQNAATGNFVLVLLTLWRWMGVNIVYYYSGLQAIPSDLYEAAEIDGANVFRKFAHITLPGIRPVLIYVLTITVMGGLSMFTESVAIWQQKNAGGVGRTIIGYMYMTGFQKNNLGMASAVGLALLVLVLAANLIQLTLMGFFRKED